MGWRRTYSDADRGNCFGITEYDVHYHRLIPVILRVTGALATLIRPSHVVIYVARVSFTCRLPVTRII
ncbi:hypothetical protein C9446_16065 [Providencia heimbachae]|nr:hypothetical protein C9446_16065 [Providencia heimbachae]